MPENVGNTRPIFDVGCFVIGLEAAETILDLGECFRYLLIVPTYENFRAEQVGRGENNLTMSCCCTSQIHSFEGGSAGQY